MQSNSLPSLQVYKFCCHGIFLRHDSKDHNQINSIQSQVRWIGFSSRPVMTPDWTRQILTNCTVLVLYNTVFSFWTDNCPSWISGRERMVADTFSWPNLILSLRFFCWDLVMKMFLRPFRPFSPFRRFKKGSCQLLAKEWALIIGKLPRRLAQERCG